MILQPVAESEEGGSIELAIAAPSPAAAGDDSLPAGESAAGNAAQQLSEIRPESGVGLFCDIEVAVAPTLPMGGSASAAIPYPNAGSLVAGTGIREVEGQRSDGARAAVNQMVAANLAGLADHLPLLLGVTVLVSRGGLRLEEKILRAGAPPCSIWQSKDLSA